MAAETEPSSARKWLTGGWAAGVVLAVFYAALLLALKDKSATLDEPGHLVAGYTYWKFNDYRLDPENGNFTKRWLALPLLGVKPPAADAVEWRNAQLVELADKWLYGPDTDAGAILARGRAAAAVLAVMLGALVWGWSRALFGPTGGMLSLLLYVLNPGMLANGGLATSDTAIALWLLLSLLCFWRMLESATLTRVLLSGIVLGVLFLTKMSAVIFIPVAAVLALRRWLDPRPLAFGGFGGFSRAGRAGVLGLIALAHCGLIAGVVWAFHGFRFSATAPEDGQAPTLAWEWAFDRPVPASALQALQLPPARLAQAAKIFEAHGANAAYWSGASRDALGEVSRSVLGESQRAQLTAAMTAPPRSLPLRAADFARRHELLPEAFIYGFAHLWRSNTGRMAFLNGEVRVNEGFRTFFPFVFATKTPLALFGVLVVALVTVTAGKPSHIGRRIWNSATFPLLVFLVFYAGAAIATHINLGHRHLLPLYPPLLVLGGAAGMWLAPRERQIGAGQLSGPNPVLFRGAVLVLLGVLAVETAWWFPNYLAYFNGLVRPAHAYRHLVDSSLDWGQDLPALRRYLQAQPASGRRYLALYGRGQRPDYHGITATRIFTGTEAPILIVPGISAQTSAAAIAEFFRTHPEFEPRIVGIVPLGAGTGAVLLRKASELRLTGGTYFIGASCLQPLYPRAAGHWTANYEASYQRLRQALATLLSDESAARDAALRSRPLMETAALFQEYDEYRFARLTAYLRSREPDDEINYSILAYRLTDAEIVRALDGPSP